MWGLSWLLNLFYDYSLLLVHDLLLNYILSVYFSEGEFPIRKDYYLEKQVQDANRMRGVGP